MSVCSRLFSYVIEVPVFLALFGMYRKQLEAWILIHYRIRTSTDASTAATGVENHGANTRPEDRRPAHFGRWPVYLRQRAKPARVCGSSSARCQGAARENMDRPIPDTGRPAPTDPRQCRSHDRRRREEEGRRVDRQ